MIPVIAIFDIGKTNKKIILFDKKYRIIREQTKQFDETTDENGDPCDDIESITSWIKSTIILLLQDTSIVVKAFNVSAYGASFVHLDKNFKILTPLYNYLNPYPAALLQTFYKTYGGDVNLSMETASPALGNLNSGLQLYRIKHERPQLFTSISYSLHLPQYISSVISSEVCTDATSIGCHTYLWDFKKSTYHKWVIHEGLDQKFPEMLKSDEVFNVRLGSQKIPVGGGLHDSSAALIPYLITFHEPFVLLSTGTWCISLNPFNDSPLTEEELKKDCLCYLSHTGRPVKASRLFSGN
jgi:sugar (pentulose or hexulose) kinase